MPNSPARSAPFASPVLELENLSSLSAKVSRLRNGGGSASMAGLIFILVRSASGEIALARGAWLALAIVGREIRMRLSTSAADFENAFADSCDSGGFGSGLRLARETH